MDKFIENNDKAAKSLIGNLDVVLKKKTIEGTAELEAGITAFLTNSTPHSIYQSPPFRNRVFQNLGGQPLSWRSQWAESKDVSIF